MDGELLIIFTLFQSTRPVRDATIRAEYHIQPVDVSIHASRTGRDLLRTTRYITTMVSIHASRTGRDLRCSRQGLSCHSFNPRVPYGTRRSA